MPKSFFGEKWTTAKEYDHYFSKKKHGTYQSTEEPVEGVKAGFLEEVLFDLGFERQIRIT